MQYASDLVYVPSHVLSAAASRRPLERRWTRSAGEYLAIMYGSQPSYGLGSIAAIASKPPVRAVHQTMNAKKPSTISSLVARDQRSSKKSSCERVPSCPRAETSRLSVCMMTSRKLARKHMITTTYASRYR